MSEKWDDKKEKLFTRDKGRCQCCRKKLNLANMTIGHRVARAIAKTNQLPNLQLECYKCNQDKNKFNKKYIKNARACMKRGKALEILVHPKTYKKIVEEENLEWFIKHNYIIVQDRSIMIGDFAIL